MIKPQKLLRDIIGAFYYTLELYESALEEFVICYKIASDRSDKKGRIKSLLMINDIKSLRGQLEEAKKNLVQLLSEVDYENQVYSCEINFRLGSIYRKMGNYTESHKKYRIAKQIAEENNFIDFRFRIMNNLGYMFYEWRDFDSAIAYYDEALEYEKSEKNNERVAMILNNIGLVYQAREDYAKAIEFYKDTLSILDEIGINGRYRANTLNNLGLCFFDLEQYDAAMEKYNLALEIHKKVGNVSGERTVLHNIGNVHFYQKEFDKAEEYFESAYDKGKDYNNIKNAHTLSSLGLIYLEKNQISKAKEFLLQSFLLRDQIMASAPNERVRIEAREKLFKILPILIQIFLLEGSIFEALAYIEHSKARELSITTTKRDNHYLPDIKNTLKQKNRNTEKIQKKNQNLLELETELKHKIISEENFIKRREEINTQIKKLEDENKKLDLNLWEKYPEYGVAMPSEPTTYLNQFLVDIPERTIVLDFFYDVYSNQILVFSFGKDKEITVFKNEITIEKVNQLKKSSESIRLLQKGSSIGKNSVMDGLLSEIGLNLFNYLIQKELSAYIEDYNPEFLILIPNNFLHSLPLELIHDGGDYWGLKYNISRAYNVSNLMNFNLNSSKIALLIGDPDSTLKYAEEEIQEIDKLLKKNSYKTKKFMKEKARLSDIIDYSDNHDYSFFHFSGHAEFNNVFPDLSYLDILDDNLDIKPLYGNEVPLNFIFRKPVLVILNACETGTMSVSIGDEINGLSRGFIVSGAKGIILNTWSVFDFSTAELFKEFYKNLLEGNSIAYSLRMARKHIYDRTKNLEIEGILHWGSCIYYGNPAIRI